jgi:hypothetical protein
VGYKTNLFNGSGSGTTYSASLYKSNAFGCNSGSEVPVTSYTNDFGGEGGTTVDLTAGSFTVPVGGAGWWTFDIYHAWATNSNGSREVRLYTNGVLQEIAGQAPVDNMRTQFLMKLVDGDIVSFKVLQSSGSTINCTSFKFKAYSRH